MNVPKPVVVSLTDCLIIVWPFVKIALCGQIDPVPPHRNPDLRYFRLADSLTDVLG